jgi:hypothetical protein
MVEKMFSEKKLLAFKQKGMWQKMRPCGKVKERMSPCCSRIDITLSYSIVIG